MSSEGESCLQLGGEGGGVAEGWEKGSGVGERKGDNSATTTPTSTMIHGGPDDTYPV